MNLFCDLKRTLEYGLSSFQERMFDFLNVREALCLKGKLICDIKHFSHKCAEEPLTSSVGHKWLIFHGRFCCHFHHSMSPFFTSCFLTLSHCFACWVEDNLNK